MSDSSPPTRRRFFRYAALAGTAAALARLSPADDRPADAADDFITPDTQTAIDRGLAYLGRAQGEDGAYYDGKAVENGHPQNVRNGTQQFHDVIYRPQAKAAFLNATLRPFEALGILEGLSLNGGIRRSTTCRSMALAHGRASR